MDEKNFLAQQFEANRGRLRGVAFRMLGSLSEAEDAVQEAWLRLNRTDAAGVDNLGGWLTTVVGRICLDMLRARKARREDVLESDGFEPVANDNIEAVLEQESQLHGAMDGAMKFVKGDAIAGIIIAFINILAGIAVGTLMHGMSVSAALHRYAVLTVGDGMASQIPSLLVSIAAGVVTTRVATRDANDSQLGEQIGKQVTAHPRALLIASVVLLAFAFVPGFPAWSFALLAIVTGGGGALLLRRRKTMPPLKLITLAEPISGERETEVGPHTSGVTSPAAHVGAVECDGHR